MAVDDGVRIAPNLDVGRKSVDRRVDGVRGRLLTPQNLDVVAVGARAGSGATTADLLR